MILTHDVAKDESDARNKNRYCRSRRGAVELYTTGGKVQEEEQVLQIKARPGETSRGQAQGRYMSVKRPEKKSDTDGTVILKDEEEGSKESRTFRRMR
ncbi:hypothetical protein JG688_00018322, partial [Phytophthora aleatoria]